MKNTRLYFDHNPLPVIGSKSYEAYYIIFSSTPPPTITLSSNSAWWAPSEESFRNDSSYSLGSMLNSTVVQQGSYAGYDFRVSTGGFAYPPGLPIPTPTDMVLDLVIADGILKEIDLVDPNITTPCDFNIDKPANLFSWWWLFPNKYLDGQPHIFKGNFLLRLKVNSQDVGRRQILPVTIGIKAVHNPNP